MDYVIMEMRWGKFRGGGVPSVPADWAFSSQTGLSSAGLERLGGGLLVYVIADGPCG